MAKGVKCPREGEVVPELAATKGPAVSEIESEEEEAKEEDSDLDKDFDDERDSRVEEDRDLYSDDEGEQGGETDREQRLIAPPQDLGLLARISELCSLFLAKYMDVYEPVAFNTRSRQRKRRGSLIKGLKTPARKPRTARSKFKAKSKSAIAADELASLAKENVLAVSNNNNQENSDIEAERNEVKKPKRVVGSTRARALSKTSSKGSETRAVVGMDTRAPGSAAPLQDSSNLTSVSPSASASASATTPASASVPAPEAQPAISAHENEGENTYTAEVPEPQDLTALESDAEAAEQGARLISLIESADWIDQHEATTLLRRLVTFHPRETDTFIVPRLEQVLFFLKQGVESLRSAQSRNALYAIEACFRSLKLRLVLDKDTMQAVIDPVIKKSVNDKRFIAAAGESVLDEMVASAATTSVLQGLLAHSSSRSAKVCTVVSKYATRCLRNLVNAQKAQVSGTSSVVVNGSSTSQKNPLDSAELAQALVSSFAELESSRSVDAKKPAQASLRILYETLRKTRFEETAKAALSAADAARVLGIVQRPVQRNTKKPSLKELMALKRREMQKQQQEQEQNGQEQSSALPATTLVLGPAVAPPSSSASERSGSAER
ncbi:Hypothetical Protein FCC1311_006012 [Hondaea fermentalgiana]|uniref:TOG domain-containing protein n=1 Tax=Hondaea fermentalgiana TaxID=2315210 RepID=A0A2R5G7E0_9STRA|nr:Hypothetical Protein FCC1311_006012 [Hondaea fermentalgiana]|eukprot:GBG24383.1 Hypothetical Protein FCC1311_006012 [Hondaea fermentalgiana]